MTISVSFRIALLAVCLGAPCSVWAQAPLSAESLAMSLQERYDGIQDFSADFVQTYRGGFLRTTSTERGTVSVRKPGMMRWLYASPEVKEFVSDGAHMYSYIPEDGQLFITDIPPDDQLGTPVLFLAGKGKIGRDFEADYVQAPVTEGSVALRLTPVEGDSNYEYLVLTLDARTLQIIGLAARDLQGGDSSIIFSNLQENRGLTDNDFVFQIPNGIDVITDDTIH